jgi:hypothetical protein
MSYKKYFITFANEKFMGALKRISHQVSLLNVFDVIYPYTDKDLESFTEFWDRHGEFVKNNPKGHGYWIWKSYLTLKTLEEMNDGDVLVYADAGCEINYEGIATIYSFIDMVKTNDKGFLSFQLNDLMYHHEERWTKMDILRHFGVDVPHFCSSLQLHSTYFVLEKCPNTMKIVNMWYDTVCNYHFIDDSPSIIENNMYFNEHRHDQSVFSVIRKLYESQFIYTPFDLFEAKYPFIDKRNPMYQSVLYDKKIVIHTWTQNVKNLQQTEIEHFWGLGDLIRGAVKLFQLSKKMNFELIIDIQHHPISKFLKCTNTKYKDLVNKNANNIEFVMPGEVEKYIESNENDIIMFLTNDLCDESDIDDECKEFIKNIFTPTDFFKEYISIKMSDIKTIENDYNIIHFRLGDEELVRQNASQYDNEILDKLMQNKEDGDILMSDSEYFKKYVQKNIDMNMFDTRTVHFGYQKRPSIMMDTLFEFFMLMNAKKIKTYSVYSWISGFVYWVHKIYDVPLEQMK